VASLVRLAAPLLPTIGRAGAAGIAILSIIAAALAGVLCIPLAPAMPASGLDPSWAYAVNEAVARHLIFGRDVIFTYGPLGSVGTQVYHPATDTLMIAGSALIGLALSAGSSMLAWPKRAHLLLLLPIVVAEAPIRDAVLLALPFLLLLVTFRLSSAPADPVHLPTGRAAILCVSVLSCAVGVLPLVKGSFSALVAVDGGLAVLMAVAARRPMLALWISSLIIGSLCIGWLAAAQPLAALPEYFVGQKEFISGYSEAMSSEGPVHQAHEWAVVTVAIAAILYVFLARRRGLGGWLTVLGFAFYSFVIFKQGFVRQDGLHVLIAGETFLFTGLFLSLMLDARAAVVVAMIACLGWSAIERSAADFKPVTVLTRIENKASEGANGMLLRVGAPYELREMFVRANHEIAAATPLPEMNGTADIYPVDLALLFANGARWSGRPSLQSYSAYAPAVAEANAAHLAGSQAPENIWFDIEPIDGRLPALEDAASWPVLLGRYSIVGFYRNYLQMVRTAVPRAVVLDDRTISAAASVNEWIDVPSSGKLVWASIAMRPTLLGKLLLAIFKLPPVEIQLRLADGRVAKDRYIPEMGPAGFLISPYVGSTADFATIAAGRDDAQSVRQVRLDVPDRGLWDPGISLSFRELHILPRQDAQ
jgi:hypothetical protein